MKHNSKPLGSLFLLSISLLVLGGCGLTANQRSMISAFGSSATSLSTNTSEALEGGRQGVIQMRSQAAILRINRSEYWNDFEGSLNRANATVRIQAVQALNTYGRLLNELVTEDQSDELMEASGRFSASLQGAIGDTISDERRTAIGEAVASITGLFLEYKRRRAVKRVMTDANPAVAAIGSLLKNEFATDGGFTTYVNGAAGLGVGITDDLQICVKNPRAANCSLEVDLDYSVRENIRNIRVTSFALKNQSEYVYPTVSDAANELVTAHANIVSSFQDGDGSLSDVSSFLEAIDALNTAITLDDISSN